MQLGHSGYPMSWPSIFSDITIVQNSVAGSVSFRGKIDGLPQCKVMYASLLGSLSLSVDVEEPVFMSHVCTYNCLPNARIAVWQVF